MKENKVIKKMKNNNTNRNKVIKKSVIALGTLAIASTAIASLAIGLSNDSENQLGLRGNEDSTSVNHKTLVIPKGVHPADFNDVLSAPVNVKDYILKQLSLSEDTPVKMKGIANSKDGTLTVVATYDTASETGKTQTFVFEGWQTSAEIDSASQAARTTIVPSVPLKTSLVSPILKAIRTYTDPPAINAALKRAKDKAIKFINAITYPVQADSLHPSGLFASIDAAKQTALKGIHDAKTIEELNIIVPPSVYKDILINKEKLLLNIVIPPKYISIYQQTMTSKYPTFSQPPLVAATLAQVEQFIIDKRAVVEAAIKYNDVLKAKDDKVIRDKREILKSLVIPTKITHVGATTTHEFNSYVKPTNDEVDALSIEDVMDAISKTNIAIHANNLYNKDILIKIKADDKVLAHLKSKLNLIMLPTQAIKNPGIVLILSFDDYKPVNINSMSKEQLRIAIWKARDASENNKKYNNEVNTKNKVQTAVITKLKAMVLNMAPEKIATSTDTPAHVFTKYTLPDNLKSLTIDELKKEIIKVQQIIINHNIHNKEVGTLNENALIISIILQDRKKILLSIKQPKELKTTLMITMEKTNFEAYTIPANIDSFTLGQINGEIIKANNAKTKNNKYNNLLRKKIEKQKVQELDNEQTIINELSPINVRAHKLTPLARNGVFTDEIATLYGLTVTLKSTFTYLYTTTSSSITIKVSYGSDSSIIGTVDPITKDITLRQLTEIEEFHIVYGEDSITDDGNGVITIHDLVDRYLNTDSNVKTMKPGFKIPKGVTAIGDNFLSSSTNMLDGFTIPDSVTTIGVNFLNSSTSMADGFTIPSSVTSIGFDFLYCSMNIVNGFTIPRSITSIGNGFLSKVLGMVKPTIVSHDQIWNGNAWVEATQPNPSSPIEDKPISQIDDMTSIYRP